MCPLHIHNLIFFFLSSVHQSDFDRNESIQYVLKYLPWKVVNLRSACSLFRADCACVAACILILNPSHYLPNKVGEQNIFSRVVMGTTSCSSVNNLPFAVQSVRAGETEMKSYI